MLQKLKKGEEKTPFDMVIYMPSRCRLMILVVCVRAKTMLYVCSCISLKKIIILMSKKKRKKEPRGIRSAGKPDRPVQFPIDDRPQQGWLPRIHYHVCSRPVLGSHSVFITLVAKCTPFMLCPKRAEANMYA